MEDNYPGAVQILDYFYAVEKIEHFAKHQFCDERKRKLWLAKQKELLLNDGVLTVIATIKKVKSKNIKGKEARKTLLSYFEQHEDRMLYKTCKDKGLLIGSGPIEAAHRNVIQQRLKLSGQKTPTYSKIP